MALTLPLFQRPGAVLFLDDDPDYLEMLGMVMPAQMQVELYARPSGFLARMEAEPAQWEADAAQQLQMIDRWRQGHALIPQVLRYWATRPERYRLARICVVDYAMPGMDGLSVLNTLLDWPGSRVLLTGQADEQIAIQSFNNGLIDQFVPKQATDITRNLLGVLRRLEQTPHARLNTMWRGVLRPHQVSLLQIPSVAQWLRDYAHHHWVEYVVTGEPFGLLGLDADGGVHWLQLEPASSLGDLAELAASAALGMDVVQDIRQGRRLAAVELHQQMGLGGAVRTARANPIGEDGLLLAATYSLSAQELPQPIYPYRHFLNEQNHRIVQDT